MISETSRYQIYAPRALRKASERAALDDAGMDIFRKIEQSLEAHRPSFGVALTRWETRWSVFAGLNDVDHIERASRGASDRTLKDAIHVALCIEATRSEGGPKDELACLLLYWLFLPGLVTVANELCNAENFDDVTAELLVGFLDAASKVTPSSTHIARHLMRGARLRALTSLRKETERSARQEELDLDRIGHDDPAGSAEVLLAHALHVGVVTPIELELLFAERHDVALAAARHELNLEAARKVKLRARHKLAAWLSETSQTHHAD